VAAVPGGGDTARRIGAAAMIAVVAAVVGLVVARPYSTAGTIGVTVSGVVSLIGLAAIADPRSAAGRLLVGYQRLSDRMSEGLGWLAKWLVPTCVTVGFVNVLLRYIGRFQHRALTSNRYIELQWMLFGAIFLISFPYVLKHGINVRVDFLFQKYSRKTKALIDFAGHIISIVPYCLFVIWATWDFAWTSVFRKGERWGTWRVWEVWEQSNDAEGLPQAPIKVLLLVGFIALLVQTVGELIKLGFVLGEKAEIAAPEIHEEPLRIE
jgi:TRAP-type mannitol/chloroaromatic compound transport system permease small subunit